MKRLLVLLPVLVLLAGCSAKESQQTQPQAEPVTQIPTETVAVTQPDELRTPLASVQLNSTDSLGFMSMGADLLLFGKDSLAIVDAATLETVVQEQISGVPLPDSGLVWTRSDGVAYYEEAGKSIVFLGTNLKETMRLQLPADMVGTAYLSVDWNTVFYCTASEIRALDMKTGISRLVMAHPAVRQSVCGVLLDGAVLNCVEQDSEGHLKSVLISAQTGEMLYEGTFLTNMVSNGSFYCLTIDHKSVEEIVFGTVDGAPRNLWPAKTPQWYRILSERNAVVTAYRAEGCIQVDYYDLASGKRSASVLLQEQEELTAFAAENDGGIWILCGECMYLWHPDLSPTEDSKVYATQRFTRSAPDAEGLAAVQEQADRLAQKYGVALLMGESVEHVVPWGYSFETEYIPRAFEDAFPAMERVMAQFPENFFALAAQKSKNKVLTIVPVRRIDGAREKGTLPTVGGVQYWLDNNLYIALNLSEDVQRSFCHEIGHVIDTRVLSTGTVLYEWEKLNPPAFRYDNDYIVNQDRHDDQYLRDSDRWFIDTYSMSFAVEDRSRIFEYACFPGNDRYFTSSIMQQKLQRVCLGIRQAFALEENEQQFIWEQYLKKG